jgi:hypothetical protein
LFHGQVGEDAQQQHVALVIGQAGTHLVDLVGTHEGQRVLLHVAATELPKGVVAVPGQDGPSALPPPLVDQPAPRDGEHPRAQARLIAVEGAQAGEDADEGLAGQVVRLGRALQAQVAGHSRGQIAVEDLECPAGARVRGSQHLGEGRSDGQAGTSSRRVPLIGPRRRTVDDTRVAEPSRRAAGICTERTCSITFRWLSTTGRHVGQLRRLVRGPPSPPIGGRVPSPSGEGEYAPGRGLRAGRA